MFKYIFYIIKLKGNNILKTQQKKHSSIKFFKINNIREKNKKGFKWKYR